MQPQVKKIKELKHEVRTMPAKFLSSRPSFKSSHSKKPLSLKNNLIIGAIVIIVLGGLMALAAWLFLRCVDQTPAPQAPAPAVQPQTPDKPAEPQAPPTTPTQDQTLLKTEEWSILENSTYFDLKYPSQWLVNQTSNPLSTGDPLQTIDLRSQTGQLYLQIKIYPNPQSLTLDDWLSASGITSFESYSLNSVPGYKYNDYTTGSYTIYVLYNSNIYSLEFTGSDTEVINKVYNLILVNFKFNLPLEPEEPQGPPVFTPGLDTDQDGLSDIEEGLYGTDLDIADSDGDSYTDGDELVNLYHPLVAGSTKIYESDLVQTYINNSYNYNIIHPKAWSVSGASDTTIFQAANGEFIQVLVVNNNLGYLTIEDWYQDNISFDLSDLGSLEVSGIPALRTPQGSRVYFLLGDNIYQLIYNIGLENTASYMTTFDMMIKSFKLMTP